MRDEGFGGKGGREWGLIVGLVPPRAGKILVVWEEQLCRIVCGGGLRIF